jgi:hypothetical protein
MYQGFDADDPTSPNGVTIRMADDFMMYCGTPCYDGNPDCRISASLYNNKMLITHDTFTTQITMNRDAGIVFNQTTVEARSGKCAYMYDGATFGRVNRGCGCAAREHGCGQEGPYWNQDCEYHPPGTHQEIDLSTCHNNTETSEDVEQCWCNAPDRRSDYPKPEDTITEALQCYFKAGGLYPPHPQKPEFHEFVKARLAHQATNDGIEILRDNVTTRYKSEYWNEVIVDAEVIIDMLTDANVANSDAVSAFMYVTGHPAGRDKAIAMQVQAYRNYDSIIPIVELDPTIDLRCSGPFRKADNIPVPEKCGAQYEQCGDGPNMPHCCQDGLECIAQNPNYSACSPPAQDHLFA